MKRRLRIVGVVLCVGGGMLALASMVIVYNAWRIALNTSAYRPAVFVVEDVSYVKNARSGKSSGSGKVDGAAERIGLAEFAPTARSQSDLEAAIPPGSHLEIWYDPTVSDVMTQGVYLRVLPRSYPLDRAFAIALVTTLLWQGPLIVGLILVTLLRNKPGVAPAPGYTTRKSRSSRDRRNRLPP